MAVDQYLQGCNCFVDCFVNASQRTLAADGVGRLRGSPAMEGVGGHAQHIAN